MGKAPNPTNARCAIYTRKSSEEGLEQAFNTLHAQREACESYILSQRHEGWSVIKTLYDDGGFSGGTMERPALQQLLGDIKAGRIDIVIVYKIDRLTRSLFDFAKIVEIFDAHHVSFVSVTQSFNTTTSMGRLTLNVLLSFAQFEREVTGERIRDKFAASKKKGIWMGGPVPLGYDLKDRKLIINPAEADTVRRIFDLYLRLGAVRKLKEGADRLKLRTKARKNKDGKTVGGYPFRIGHLYAFLRNPLYVGRIAHKGQSYPGDHKPIIDQEIWDKVQAQLTSNAQDRRSGASAREASLLVGLLYDDNGKRMTPSHAVKKGKRYRYYLSNNLITGNGLGIRIAAHEIENPILYELGRFLRDRIKLTEMFPRAGKDPMMISEALNKANAHSRRITDGMNAEKRLLIQQLIDRIILSEKNICIVVNRNGLAMLCGIEIDASKSKEPFVLQVAATLRRLGKEKKLIIAGQTSAQKLDPALIKAVVRAHRWFEMLRTSQVQSISEIAAKEKLSRTYVISLLPLAFLAPDIIEAILEARHPIGLSLIRILAQPQPLLEWGAQRSAFGFADRQTRVSRVSVQNRLLEQKGPCRPESPATPCND
jgi:site-specific DNA recombinase